MRVDGQAVSGVTQLATGFEGGVDLERALNGDLIYASFGDDAGTGSVQQIVYGDHAPTAQASATPSQGVPPLTVTLSAAGSADVDGDPLTYEWDLDGDGAPDATGLSVRHTYPAGVHRATVKVRDDHGLAANATVEILADESPPTATILAPAAGSHFRLGRPITLRGSGADAQDGTLGDAALHWRMTLHHGNHTHLIEADRTGREISFTPPTDHDAGSFLEFRLTAEDSSGLTGSAVRTVQPETIALRLDSSPPGAVLSYAGSCRRWARCSASRRAHRRRALPGSRSTARRPRHPARRLRGHVVGASGRPRVDVALRLRRAHGGCRCWWRPLRRLSARAARCGRPLWMRAVVDRSGRWQLDLRGRPRRGSYVVLMRARTPAARPQLIAQATAKVRIR